MERPPRLLELLPAWTQLPTWALRAVAGLLGAGVLVWSPWSDREISPGGPAVGADRATLSPADSLELVVRGTVEGALHPGVPRSVAATVRNDGDRDAVVHRLRVDITDVDAPSATRELSCSVDDFAVIAGTRGRGRVLVEAGATVRLGSGPAADTTMVDRPVVQDVGGHQVLLKNLARNQDGCKGARLQLAFTVEGMGRG